jgi:hypothetical protein
MVVHQDQGTAVPKQCIAHHLARVHRCLAHRAPEHLDVVQHPVLRVQVHHGKHLVRQMAQTRAQEVLDHRGRVHQVAASHLSGQQLLRRQQDLVGLSWPV